MILLEILQQTLMIVVFVIVMMLVIEYITLQTKNKNFRIGDNPCMKIIFAAILGIMPGCLGTFAVVSMYVHRTLGLAALVAALIATSGDETFVMFSMIPNQTIYILGGIFLISISVGFFIRILKLDKKYLGKEKHIHLHKENVECVCFESDTIFHQLKNLIWQRAVILLTAIIFIAFLIISGIYSEHNDIHADSHSDWGWEKITFLVVTVVGLAITLTVPDHFLKKHLWEHIIKKHFLKLFLWTFSAFIALYVLNQFLDIENWIKTNIYIVMLVAILIGVIPESGPHIIFISMFAGGLIPLSVLIANSIVQDGHGAIPLLAESPKGFIIAKGINVLVGLLVGYSMLLIGI